MWIEEETGALAFRPLSSNAVARSQQPGEPMEALGGQVMHCFGGMRLSHLQVEVPGGGAQQQFHRRIKPVEQYRRRRVRLGHVFGPRLRRRIDGGGGGGVYDGLEQRKILFASFG